MPKQPSKPTAPGRAKSLPKAGGQTPRSDLAAMSPAAIQRLVEDLRTHQIELETQNEELRKAQADLALSRDRLNHLYDAAPVGYMTLAPDGTILEANLTLATLLALPRGKLLRRQFARFIAREAADAFHLHCREVFATDLPCTCQLEVRPAHGEPRVVQLESRVFTDPVLRTPVARTAVIDVTQRTQAEATIQRQLEELRVANEDLARFNRVAVGRELRVIEMKKEVNALCQQFHLPPRYPVALEAGSSPNPHELDPQRA